MKDALQIIISRSAAAADEAMDCLKAIRAKSPMVVRRYENAVGLALSDPQASFTADERALIASYLAGDEGALKPRSVRLSDEDWAQARKIGGGDATVGIRKALKEYAGK